MTADELQGASAWDLKIMRNEIFARHGYVFKTDDMKRYFSQQAWYRPQSDDVLASLSPIELANVETIKPSKAADRSSRAAFRTAHRPPGAGQRGAARSTARRPVPAAQ